MYRARSLLGCASFVEQSDPMSELVVGRRDEDHLEIRVLRRSHPQTNDYWDGNWVESEIGIHIRPWRATYQAQLRTEEFSRFRDQLRDVYDGTRWEASFEPMEPWLELTLESDALGHVTIKGQAGAEGFGKIFGQVRLNFHLTGVMDQTDLPPLIAALDGLAREYPTKGRPTD
jgi:hypothetical protein